MHSFVPTAEAAVIVQTEPHEARQRGVLAARSRPEVEVGPVRPDEQRRIVRRRRPLRAEARINCAEAEYQQQQRAERGYQAYSGHGECSSIELSC